jgi:hypothetical protein
MSPRPAHEVAAELLADLDAISDAVDRVCTNHHDCRAPHEAMERVRRALLDAEQDRKLASRTPEDRTDGR